MRDASTSISRAERQRRGAPPLRTYDCFAYFPPAARRCSLSVTSVCGHLYCTELQSSTAAEQRRDSLRDDVQAIFGAKAHKLVGGTSARLGVREHLRARVGRGRRAVWKPRTTQRNVRPPTPIGDLRHRKPRPARGSSREPRRRLRRPVDAAGPRSLRPYHWSLHARRPA